MLVSIINNHHAYREFYSIDKKAKIIKHEKNKSQIFSEIIYFIFSFYLTHCVIACRRDTDVLNYAEA